LLFWIKLFLTLIFLTLIIFNLYTNTLISTLLVSELLIILICFVYFFAAIINNIIWVMGFSFIIVILGGLEIALSFLLLNL